MTFPTRSGTQLRNAELAQIHIARAQLGLDEDTYRAVLWTVGRVKSAKDLDWTGRKQLLEHFKAKGWKPAPPKQAKTEKPMKPGQDALVKALWNELHKAGKVRDGSDAALGSWLKRNHWPERPEWLNYKQINQAIEGLKKWLER
ncbi:MAG: regulatory protein GemA [Thiobacillus sp.]|uniref:gp16 family protein n=1 Tax=Thiobacillus sp. TaxID=924 RepID=UPI00289618A1|nr:regulatory protein GemA [Thiobacillus sp.]MDT3707446.1 regulatory protein GemA [Thiobacillus sp.]